MALSPSTKQAVAITYRLLGRTKGDDTPPSAPRVKTKAKKKRRPTKRKVAAKKRSAVKAVRPSRMSAARAQTAKKAKRGRTKAKRKTRR